ncbi:hypothetical protein RVH45_19270 [Phocaeicola dorei]|uniref:Uncharacterized protein n=1 Tax=Phocaeicola dorei TaxID=357276 RepID=A0AAE4LY18_9BACT|nr:hypothetical protein [Phocaeicola dorei]MDU0271986.1 hypothetical protein [Phocaeicola dorei]
MNNRRFHSTGKGNSAPLPAGQGHAASGFRENHPRKGGKTKRVNMWSA